MEVTAVRVSLLNTENKVKAIGQFTLDDAFVVTGIRVMENGKGGNFVSFPARENKNGEYEDVAFPITKELYQKISEAVVAEYKRVMEESQAQGQNETPIKDEAQEAAPVKRGKAR